MPGLEEKSWVSLAILRVDFVEFGGLQLRQWYPVALTTHTSGAIWELQIWEEAAYFVSRSDFACFVCLFGGSRW